MMLEIMAEGFAFLQANTVLVLLICCCILIASMALLLLHRTHQPDRAEEVFQRAGLRVADPKVAQLREEFARIATDAERQKIADENRQQAEIAALQREKIRVLNTVQNTPLVVKEVGEALESIEREYERKLRTMKSEQARESLRLIAEKQINDVLRSVNQAPTQLPHFNLSDTTRKPPIVKRYRPLDSPE